MSSILIVLLTIKQHIYQIFEEICTCIGSHMFLEVLIKHSSRQFGALLIYSTSTFRVVRNNSNDLLIGKMYDYGLHTYAISIDHRCHSVLHKWMMLKKKQNRFNEEII